MTQKKAQTHFLYRILGIFCLWCCFGIILVDAQEPIIHRVTRGDNLYRIATQYGVTTDDIIAANNISDPTLIFEGQELVIPVGGFTPAPTTTPSPTTETLTPQPSATVEQPSVSQIELPPSRIQQADVEINNVSLSQILILPDAVRQHIHRIYARGQEMGRNPQSFAKVGDSTVEYPFFLSRFDDPTSFDLGEYAYLNPIIDYYAGSFGRESLSVKRGMHTWAVFDPLWVNNVQCEPEESPIQCEFRLHNPSVVFIRLGSNDAGNPNSINENLRRMVEFSLENGVIPIIGTKADRIEGQGNQTNEFIRQISIDYKIPLWDFDLAAQAIPGGGLEADGIHLTTFFTHNWNNENAFSFGHGVHALTALMMLYEVWLELGSPEIIPTPTPVQVVTDQQLVDIYSRGQTLGNNPNVFTTVGDSITASPNFLQPIGYGEYNLGDYVDLQRVISHFSASLEQGINSFGNESVAAQTGWTANIVLEPGNTDPTKCFPEESPLVCEYRRSKPAIALILFGTNDVQFREAYEFRADMTRIIEISKEQGVIPVISTIPLRLDQVEAIAEFNTIITELAIEHQIPLWDYAGELQGLPNNGLTTDNIHPSAPPGGTKSATAFFASNLQYGYVIRNLSALQILDDVLQQIGIL